MAIYEKIEIDGKEYLSKLNDDDSITFIPLDESNSDYQAYLASLDEQQAALKDK